MCKEDPGAAEGLGIETTLVRFDSKECVELSLPLAEQRLGDHEQHSPHPLSHQLRDDQARLDGLAETDLIRKDAAALGNAPKGKYYGVNLVRIGIYAALPLARSVASLLV